MEVADEGAEPEAEETEEEKVVLTALRNELDDRKKWRSHQMLIQKTQIGTQNRRQAQATAPRDR